MFSVELTFDRILMM